MFQQVDLSGGRRLFFRDLNKFKTLTFRVILEGRMDTAVEEQAMLPFLLKRGCARYPSQRALARALASLYGAALALDVSKAGNRQLFVTSMDLVDPRFLSGGSDLLREGVDALNQVLLHPLTVDGAFSTGIFEEERLNLERYVRSVIDDKMLYTHLRLVEEMFRGDPFGNYEWGRLDRIRTLQSSETYDAYRRLLRNAPLTLYVVGRIDERALHFIADHLAAPEDRFDAVPASQEEREEGASPSSGDSMPVIVEEYPLSQSKLAMGFHVDMRCSDEEYLALMLYSSILGGGSFSKLFKTVREKHGLAYYVHASVDRLKGFLAVAAGIDAEHFEAVTSLVRASMEDMAAGRLSEEEFEHAKRTLGARFRSVEDSAGQMIEYDYLNRMVERRISAREAADRVEAMTPGDAASVAGRIRPGCTFFLKGTGEHHGLT